MVRCNPRPLPLPPPKQLMIETGRKEKGIGGLALLCASRVGERRGGEERGAVESFSTFGHLASFKFGLPPSSHRCPRSPRPFLAPRTGAQKARGRKRIEQVRSPSGLRTKQEVSARPSVCSDRAPPRPAPFPPSVRRLPFSIFRFPFSSLAHDWHCISVRTRRRDGGTEGRRDGRDFEK